MTRAILLCAGYGTRLGSLSDACPKPMLPVCDIPVLRYGIALLRGHGICDIAINLHHHGDQIHSEIGDGSDLGVRIHYFREARLLGTGGGIKNALPALDRGDDQPILSLNGKLIFDLDIAALLSAYQRADNALGMMVVRKVPDALSWGAVDVSSNRNDDRDGDRDVPRVRDILGQGQYMFCGVHVTRPSVVRRLPEGETCMIRQGYLPWLRGGETVAAFIADCRAYFAEHSTPARYLQSNVDLLQGAPLAHPPGPTAGIESTAQVSPGAVIRTPVRIGHRAIIASDAIIGPNVVVGHDAVVAPGTRVERAVIWPHARAEGQLSSCIVTPSGVTGIDRDAG